MDIVGCYPFTRATLWKALGVLVASLSVLPGCYQPPTLQRIEDERRIQLLQPGRQEGLPDPTLAICISGGGYRSTLFSLGALAALHDMGILEHADSVVAVSGGAITAASLILNWQSFAGDPAERALLDSSVGVDLLHLTSRTVDLPAIIKGMLIPRANAAHFLAKRLDEDVFRSATVADVILDDAPRLLVIATEMSEGTPFVTTFDTFSEGFNLAAAFGLSPILFDHIYDVSAVPLASAVAASAGYPPFFAPTRWALSDGGRFGNNAELSLADGGLVDNTAVNNCAQHARLSIVIDAGRIASGDYTIRILVRCNDRFDRYNSRSSADLLATCTARKLDQL